MGHRLSRIYTRTGDDGTTGLADGRRVSKHDARVEALGTVDEANSAIGCVLAAGSIEPELESTLKRVQHDLFEIGAELSSPDYVSIGTEDVARLEHELDRLNRDLPPLKEFILPGGNRAAAACHLARTICRRAERRAFTLAAAESVNREALRYLNRLSDLLFVAARVLARADGGSEVLWQRHGGAQR